MENSASIIYIDACDWHWCNLVHRSWERCGETSQYSTCKPCNPKRRWPTIEKEVCLWSFICYKDIRGKNFHLLLLTSLFNKDLNNTKIQHWAVLWAEHRAIVKYWLGKNTWANMLSSINLSHKTYVIDAANHVVGPWRDWSPSRHACPSVSNARTPIF